MSVHKAQFSCGIVAEIRDVLLERYPYFWARPKLWDPYAGPGLRLAEIAGEDFDYGGTEIEECFIVNSRIIHGTATDIGLYPQGDHVIVTSPVYPNGIADHHKAADESERNTYRSWVARIEGQDRELAEDNMGRYGYRGTKPLGVSVKRKTFWDIAHRTVRNWDRAELVILNVSDFISGNIVEPYVADWVKLMMQYGWSVSESRRVETPRLRLGENSDVRVPFEVVLVFERRGY